jgi:hypothetical protein
MTEAVPPPQPIARRKLLLGGAGALVVAAAIAVVFVLPAEFDIDPTGLGRAMGLTQLSEGGKMTVEQARGAKREGVLAPLPDGKVDAPKDRYTVELAPFESIEMKYTMDEGAKMPFAWHASAPLDYDMHAHPFEGGTELTESYSVTKADGQSGLYTAQFSGIHGWFWQNRNTDNVTLVLDAAGDIGASTIFDQYGEHPREFTPPGAGA